MLWDNLLDENFSDEEIASLVAHEQGHFIYQHNEHQRRMRIIMTLGAVLFATSSFWVNWYMSSSKAIFWGIELPIILFQTYIFVEICLLFHRAIARQMEYIADSHAVNVGHDPENIINALIKQVDASYVVFDPTVIDEFIYEDHPSTKKRSDIISRKRQVSNS